MLLLFDNCENHLVEVVDLVASLLARCLAVQVPATSRPALNVRGEFQLVVDSLPLPEDTLPESELRDNDAVRRFLERARAVSLKLTYSAAALRAAAGICRQLDGLPLAVELAAARVRALLLATLRSRPQQPILSKVSRCDASSAAGRISRNGWPGSRPLPPCRARPPGRVAISSGESVGP